MWLNVLLRLLLGGVGCGGFGCGVGVFLGEAFDAARSVEELLFAGEKRVAIGADFDAQHRAFDRRARGEIVSTGTVNGNGVIVRVNTGFHQISILVAAGLRRMLRLAATTAVSLGREKTIIAWTGESAKSGGLYFICPTPRSNPHILCSRQATTAGLW